MSNAPIIRRSDKVRGKRLVIAYIHPGQVSAYFLEGMLATALYDSRTEGRIQNILQDWSSANVSQSRNKLTAKFLDECDAEWLLWIDADMAFTPDAVYRLMDAADPVERPIVGGLCFGAAHDRLFPTIYLWGQTEAEKIVTYRPADYPRDVVAPVAATGAAFLLIHRDVLSKIRDHGFNRTFPWFQETEYDGDPVGEDLTFCLRAGQLGIPVHVHTGVRIGHHKSTVLTEDVFDAQRRASDGADPSA